MGAQTSVLQVILLGMGTVFVGLGLLVLLCNVLRMAFHREEAAPAQPAAQAAQLPQGAERRRLLAAVTAAIAEAEGTDAPGFRIVSFVRR